MINFGDRKNTLKNKIIYLNNILKRKRNSKGNNITNEGEENKTI